MVRLRNEIPASVQRTGWRSVRELADGVDDPAPHRGAVVIVLRRELIGTCAVCVDADAGRRLARAARKHPSRQRDRTGLDGVLDHHRP
jgi:hypothetical protein